jgi:predicted DNA-binding protein (MmcQ/YjbR family)
MGNKPEVVLAKMREICLALPDTKETLTWGYPHFRVGEKIFAGWGSDKDKQSIGFKLEMDHADAMVMNDPRFTRAPYVGHKGWVSMDPTTVKDWNEVRDLVFESYRLIAPKRTLARLAKPGDETPKKPTAKTAPKKPTAKTTVKKTVTKVGARKSAGR